ncbi:bifunctional SulP family inorganic anion transporter/carbonic anhydrase [Candidatus Laterigemmans baculatus]|uniref:bifunctional SulP family inorganic anion transporter/carbonic anhydrase n=1 Tax=Candidatus Laterigemmans baculatus TaxID=2770505 RepID=UPI0013DB3E49|nr:SulP family inorganic anion transporter [Candidatus Laterigemmans baculatus]
MKESQGISLSTLPRDLIAGLVVFLVALPLCLGVALASNAPLFSGLIAGIVGGIVVGIFSGSHTSVSGPAAGLTAIVAAQIAALGSFEAFLLAVVIGGALQVALGIAKAGALSAFFPLSVIKGLLAAIGVILILKQIPHVFGHDTDPEGDLAFQQPDQHNTFSEIFTLFQGEIHLGATVIGLLGIVLLVLWDKWKPLKRSGVPGPLVVVLIGVAIHLLFQRLGGPWLIEASHLVQVPVAESPREFLGFFQLPDFSQLTNPAVYVAGVTVAIVASLETLLNLEAVDKLDPKQRHSPPSRELLAQGVGNMTAGLLGGIPVTSVIIRSSVNVNSGAQSKLSTIFHGTLLIGCVMFLPVYLNMIPLAALAAILLVTGFKLASPALFRQMWAGGRYQFLPFIITLSAIVLTDLLIGIVIGLVVSTLFILNSNLRRPIRRVVETHVGGNVLHIELANQVSFLNRAALDKVLRDAPRGTHVLIDATETDYIDPDIMSLIDDFKNQTAPAHGVEVSLRGFRDKYSAIQDETRFADYTTRELQGQVTARQVITMLEEGNERFRTNKRLSRDFNRQLSGAAQGQHPLAVVLSCIDSRAPAELVFDLGLGDIFSVRVAGNVTSDKVLGSMEYGTAVAGAKLIVVMGHTRCGAVTASIDLACAKQDACQATGCHNLDSIVQEIQMVTDPSQLRSVPTLSAEEKLRFVDGVARDNVLHTVRRIIELSPTIEGLVAEGRVAIVGALYDVASGHIDFMIDEALGLEKTDRKAALAASNAN